MHSPCENPDLPFDLLYASRHPDLVARDLMCASKYLVEQKERMPFIHELVGRNLDTSAGMHQRSDSRRFGDEGVLGWAESLVVLPALCQSETQVL